MVNKVIPEADILLLVLDARMVEETRNDEIEKKVNQAGKPLIYVLNKCDLVDKAFMEEWKRKLPDSVFISAKDHLGTLKLREKIMMTAHRKGLEDVKVGVIGYPNVGKSSVINSLKGKGAASTSSMSGHTRHIQKISSRRIMLLDTPGVIPYSDTVHHQNPREKLAMIGSVDHTRIKEPDIVVGQLIKKFPGVIEDHYKVPEHDDSDDTIEAIAVKYNLKSKGDIPDIARAARLILKDWQTGKIKRKG